MQRFLSGVTEEQVCKSVLKYKMQFSKDLREDAETLIDWPHPYTFFPIGDGELSWWIYPWVRRDKNFARLTKWPHLDVMALRSGLDPYNDRVLGAMFEEAIYSSPFVVAHHQWMNIMHLSATVLDTAGLLEKDKKFLDCALVYHAYDMRVLHRLFKNMRLLLIGSRSHLIAQKLGEKKFIEDNQLELNVVGSVWTPSRFEQPKNPYLMDILGEVKKAPEFDIALLACGSLSFVIGQVIRGTLGKTAIDFGCIDRMILGGKTWGGRGGFQVPEQTVSNW